MGYLGRSWSVTLVVVISSLVGFQAGAASISISTVATTDTAIPDRIAETFADFGAPSLDAGRVAFRGSRFGDGAGQGLYTDLSGSLETVVDATTPIPGGNQNFRLFGNPSIDGGDIAFGDGFGNGNSSAIFVSSGGSLTTIVDDSVAIPGGSMLNFGTFGAPSIDAGVVSLVAGPGGGSATGVYSSSGGPLSVVADRGTAIPGGSVDFDGFFSSSSDAGVVAFHGAIARDGFGSGIYTQTGSSLELVADENTQIPGGTATFGRLEFPSTSNGEVAFRGAQFGDGFLPGIYTNAGGALRLVADTDTPVPGGTGNFGAFGNPSLSDGEVAFLGTFGDSTPIGLFATSQGILERVIGIDDMLDGKTVRELEMGREGFDNNQLAFRARFSDGSSGIFVATIIPEPSTALLLGTGLVWLARNRSRPRPSRALA